MMEESINILKVKNIAEKKMEKNKIECSKLLIICFFIIFIIYSNIIIFLLYKLLLQSKKILNIKIGARKVSLVIILTYQLELVVTFF